MGWARGRFPVLAQLNMLTTPGQINDTKAFFLSRYRHPGNTTLPAYKLGDICADWRGPSGSTTLADPPWEDDRDNPWSKPDAEDWRHHCQTDLNVPNTGSGGTAGNTVYDDLTDWITTALTAATPPRLKYKYRRGGTTWKADIIKSSTMWKITVTGPGF